MHCGSADFWKNGYSFYYEMATHVSKGEGLNVADRWAVRTPLYPLFLSLTTVGGRSYLWIVVPQAMIGAATAFCAFLIGRVLFGSVVGLLASALTATYPYYVAHDTALQETSLFTLLTALSVFLLLNARQTKSTSTWAFAGLSLGVTVLARPTIVPFALGALVWVWAGSEGTLRLRLHPLLAVLLPFCLIVGSWLARNSFILGTPTLTSEVGVQLWVGNNPYTFTHYPGESDDRVVEAASAALTPGDQAQLDALAGSEVGEDDWFLRRALDYIHAHPRETARAAGRKLLAGFSWTLNPARDRRAQIAYSLSYAPISILGIVGAGLTWRRWRELSLIYLLFLSFAAVAAVFFAHTSHRSFLDVYLIVFAAHALQFLRETPPPGRSGSSRFGDLRDDHEVAEGLCEKGVEYDSERAPKERRRADRRREDWAGSPVKGHERPTAVPRIIDAGHPASQ